MARPRADHLGRLDPMALALALSDRVRTQRALLQARLDALSRLEASLGESLGAALAYARGERHDPVAALVAVELLLVAEGLSERHGSGPRLGRLDETRLPREHPLARLVDAVLGRAAAEGGEGVTLRQLAAMAGRAPMAAVRAVRAEEVHPDAHGLVPAAEALRWAQAARAAAEPTPEPAPADPSPEGLGAPEPEGTAYPASPSGS